MAMRTLSQTIKALEARIENPSYGDLDCDILDYLQELDKLKKRSFTVPSLSVQKVTDEGVTGVIRCENCKWWDRLEDGHPYGYCRACRSGTHTERWEISIYRQNRYDFYCADAEPKENEDEDE